MKLFFHQLLSPSALNFPRCSPKSLEWERNFPPQLNWTLNVLWLAIFLVHSLRDVRLSPCENTAGCLLPAGERFWVLPPAHFTHEALFSKSQEVISVERGLWRRLSCLLPVRNVSLTHSLHLILKASSKVEYLCVNATFTACCSLNAELLPLTETVFSP